MSERRVRIGVMIDNVDDDFQKSIWAGISEAAAEAGVDSHFFLGGDLLPPERAPLARNGIFDLIGPGSVDGLLVAATVMATHVGNARLDAYCARFRPLPMVSLGFVLPSMPSVVAEGQSGLGALIEHLAQRHGRRRFMFVGGTAENDDSTERERVFRATLAALGLPVDEALVLRARFKSEVAYEKVREAAAEGREFDAVVAANDEMAIAAMAALADAGIPVPERVAVTGYDDVPGARRLALPLTTVRQPLPEMSRRAVALLLDLLGGREAARVERFPTRIVTRRSCGCFSRSLSVAGGAIPRGAPALRAAAERAAAAIVEELAEAHGGALGGGEPDGFRAIAASFWEEAAGLAPPGATIDRLDGALRAARPGEADEDAWDDFLSLLRRESPGGAGAELSESLLHQARVLVKESAQQRQWREKALLAKRTLTLQFVVDALISSFGVPTLLDAMARELPRVGIGSCFLVLHERGARPFAAERLVLAYTPEGRIPLPQGGLAFRAAELLPAAVPAFPARADLCWQTLAFGGEEMGYLGLALDPLRDISGLALAEQIRSALKASAMMQEISEKDALLSDLDRLKNDFIAGITHDFRSLVTVIMNAAAMGSEAGSLGEAADLFGAIRESALKLKVAVDRLLDLASMDERGLALRIGELEPVAFLRGIVDYYEPVLARAGIAIAGRFPAEVRGFFTDRDKVEEIMHNLISNAAKFVEPGRGRIEVALEDAGGTVAISVADNGAGIDAERLAGIFVRFKAAGGGKGGGSGIGLSFVKELAGYLKGGVEASSEGPGRGARFVLRLPKGAAAFGEAPPRADAPIYAKRDEYKTILESYLRAKGGAAPGGS